MVSKIDIRHMFASVPHVAVARTLEHFDVPVFWRNLLMHQIVANRFLLKTVRVEVIEIELRRGLIEGSPISVIIIGLVLTFFLVAIKELS